MSLRIAQISDCHLFEDREARLKGIATCESFLDVLHSLRNELDNADRLIITGDLTHDEKPETYAWIREQVSPWLSKVRMVPGNHDDRAIMRAVFGDVIQTDGERNVFHDVVGTWNLIGLDSQVPGDLRGSVGETQLKWLADKLMECAAKPAAIFLHHPPVPVGSAWLDQIWLTDAAALWEVIRRFPQVKVICTGHVHQEMAVAMDLTMVLTVPSTGVQFRPETEKLVVDSVPPGYRILELQDNGEVRTRVFRCS